MKMNRNPENEAEIQNAAFGQSRIMMRIRIVKSARNEEEQEDDEKNLSHGTKLMKELFYAMG